MNNFPINHSLAFIEYSTHKRSRPQNRLKEKKWQQHLPNALRLTRSFARSLTSDTPPTISRNLKMASQKEAQK